GLSSSTFSRVAIIEPNITRRRGRYAEDTLRCASIFLLIPLGGAEGGCNRTQSANRRKNKNLFSADRQIGRVRKVGERKFATQNPLEAVDAQELARAERSPSFGAHLRLFPHGIVNAPSVPFPIPHRTDIVAAILARPQDCPTIPAFNLSSHRSCS